MKLLLLLNSVVLKRRGTFCISFPDWCKSFSFLLSTQNSTAEALHVTTSPANVSSFSHSNTSSCSLDVYVFVFVSRWGNKIQNKNPKSPQKSCVTVIFNLVYCVHVAASVLVPALLMVAFKHNAVFCKRFMRQEKVHGNFSQTHTHTQTHLHTYGSSKIK